MKIIKMKQKNGWRALYKFTSVARVASNWFEASLGAKGEHCFRWQMTIGYKLMEHGA
jgi:hypothetical protein